MIDGRRILITGGTSGIGLATALELARRGAAVTLTSRSGSRAEAAAAEVRRLTGGDARGAELELSDLDHVRGFAADRVAGPDGLDVLINNAGSILGRRRSTAEGLERTFVANYLGPFLLTNLLLPLLLRAREPRVVNVSSELYRNARGGVDLDDLAHERGWSASRAYARSKLALMLFTLELRTRFASRGVTAVALHPGVVRTGFGRGPDGSATMALAMRVLGPFMRTPERGAETSVLLATRPTEELGDAWYWSEGRPVTPRPIALDADAGRELWRVSERLTGLAGGDPQGAGTGAVA